MFHKASRATRAFPSGFAFTCGALRVLVVVVGLTVAAGAHADDYADVNVLIKGGKLGEALSKAEQYLAGKPRDPQMRFIKGVIQTESGKPADAIATFTQITQDYPELPEPYNNLAVLYANQSQFDKARAALEMAIRTNPSYATAHENLGDVYAKLASQAYSKALQLDGSNTGVQPKLALIRTLFTPEPRSQKPGVPAPTAPAAAAPAAVKTPVAAAVTPSAKAPVIAAVTPSAKAPVVAATAPPAKTPVVSAAVAPPAKAPVVAAVTPPAAAAAVTAAVPKATQVSPVADSSAEKDVEAAVRAWAAAWASKDVSSYLGSYGKDFATPSGLARKAWEEDRRTRIVGKSRIAVKLDNLSVAVNGDKARARFKQGYSADSLNVSSRKTLDLAKAGERWVIVRESTGG